MKEMTIERALGILIFNFNEVNGWISKKNAGYVMSDLEYDAMDYLTDEWDYHYSSTDEGG